MIYRKDGHWLLALSFLLVLSLTSCSKKQVAEEPIQEKEVKSNEYKIAVAAPQFGPYEALGRSIVNGVELAVDQKNKAGGINNKKIKLIKVDDGGLPGEGTWRARTLVKQMVLGVIGHLNSDISIPASEIYAKSKIPIISPASTSPFFTQRESVHGYVFRTIGRDDVQGKLASQYVLNNKYSKVAVLFNDRSYGSSVASEFLQDISSKKEEGALSEVVLYKTYKVGTDDFTKEVELFKEKQPDAVFFIGEYGDASRFLAKLREEGLQTSFVGSDGVFDQAFITSDDASSEGAVIISSASSIDKIFIQQYKEKFKSELGSYSAPAFDAANILISAIEKTKDMNSEKVAEEIKLTKDFKGTRGSISFDDRGDLLGKAFSFYKVQDGRFISID